MAAQIGQRAPNLSVSEWVQGMPTNIDREADKVVLVEVFQVNCPGCFMHGIPEAIRIYNELRDEGVRVLGLATAFEDYDKNTVENLRMLAETGEVVGDTLQTMGQYGQLDGNRLRYRIPFPLGMDSLSRSGPAGEGAVMGLIRQQVPDFDAQPPEYRERVLARARQYLESKEYVAETFERYALRGTPSAILIDRKGVLRSVAFGQDPGLERSVRSLAAQ